MAAAKLSQTQSLRQELEIASAAIPDLEAALGEAVLSGDAEAIDAARQVLADARQRVADLRAALPLAEAKEEARKVEKADQKAIELRKRLQAELKALIKDALSYSIHTANQVSAFRRMVRQASVILGLLFHSRHPKLDGLTRALAPLSIHRLCSRELSRLGLPALSSDPLGGGLPAPGAGQQPEYYHAPSRMPSLEGDFRALAAAILAALPEPLGSPQVSSERADLPQVAATAESAPTASPEPATGIPAEEAA
jgi:hypothetical protein